MTCGRTLAAVLAAGSLATACSTDGEGTATSGDASDGTGGSMQAGAGGAAANGGTGTSTAGGSVGASTGGATNAGGGGPSNGGAASGGASTGGSTASGGTHGSGDGGSAGAVGSGGAGGTSSGGSPGSGGAGTGGTGSTGTKCKRGIAANTAPGAQFFPAITWWYNWAMQPSGTDVGIEFVPMMWGSSSVSSSIRAGSKFLLTFNEPNFKSQSNLTPQEAASYWPTIESKANAAGTPIVGPGMNFCGPAANCNGTSPYQYLKDFFAACSGCQVDYVAVHWYNCDLPSLQAYLEGNANLEGFVQFGKPIWLTEFSCNGSASVAEQEAYMRAAVPYLESNPHVFRYSWFSAGPIPNAKLINDDGTPTALGNVYMGLDQNCP